MNTPEFGSGFLLSTAVAGAVVAFLVNLLIALRIRSDAKKREHAGKSLAFFGPGMWFFVIWLSSIAGVGMYWLMHYSSLRHPEEFPGR